MQTHNAAELNDELSKPLAGRLLRGSPLMRLANVCLNGTYSVISDMLTCQ